MSRARDLADSADKDIAGTLTVDAVDVQGTVTADGLTVDGDGTLQTSDGAILTLKSTDTTLASTEVVGSIQFNTADSSDAGVASKIEANAENASGEVGLNFHTGKASALIKRVNINRDGDISFYDTSANQAFYWDASAASLGIGTDSPSKTLDVEGNIRAKTTGGASAAEIDIVSGTTWRFRSNATSGTNSYGLDLVKGSAGTDVKMSIDSSGNVGIGTSGPVSKLDIAWGGYQTSGYALTVGADIGNTSTRTNNTIKYGIVSGVNYSNSEKQVELLTHTSNSISNTLSLGGAGNTALTSPTEILFLTSSTQNGAGGTERMRIDSSGNVGIGNTGNSLRKVDITQESGQDAGVRVINGGSGAYYQMFTGTANPKIGSSHHTDQIEFHNNSGEAMRIDSSGNLLVGTTDTFAHVSSSSGEGVSVSGQYNAIYASRSGGELMQLNRQTSDGEIIRFRKDGSTVGSIGANSGSLFIASPYGTDSGLRIGNSNVSPATTAGAARDAAIDLGYSSNRFKDLYLSGKTHYGVSGQTYYQVVRANGDGLYLGADDGNTGGSGADIRFNVKADEKMRITNSGNVGIGTSSPDGSSFSATSSPVVDVSGTQPLIILSETDSNTKKAWVGLSSDDFFLGGTNTNTRFYTNGSERMRIDSDGNLLVTQGGTNATPGVGDTDTGVTITETNAIFASRSQATQNSSHTIFVNRNTTTGGLIGFYQAGSQVGTIGSQAGDLYIANAVDVGLYFESSGTDHVAPCDINGAKRDNAIDLGASSARFDDIYATNGTIQTSDRNEKQDIEELSEAEQRVAVAAKSLLRKFRWKDAVAEKGDDARIHFGIIAQDLQAAFEAEGLDAGRYAMFIYSEWWETYTDVPAVESVDAVYETVVIPAVTEERLVSEAVLDEEGNEIEAAVYETVVVQEETTEERLVSEAVEAKEAYTRIDTYNSEEEAPEGAVKKSRMGVRYSELLAFIIAAI